MSTDDKNTTRKGDKARIVIVLWRDAHADGGSWMSVDDIDDSPYLVESVGFVLEGVKKGHISICQSFGDDEGVIDHVLHVPSEMVVEITNVRLPLGMIDGSS